MTSAENTNKITNVGLPVEFPSTTFDEMCLISLALLLSGSVLFFSTFVIWVENKRIKNIHTSWVYIII